MKAVFRFALLVICVFLTGCFKTDYQIPFAERIKMLNSGSLRLCDVTAGKVPDCGRTNLRYYPTSRTHAFSINTSNSQEVYRIRFREVSTNSYVGLIQDNRNENHSYIAYARFERNRRRLVLRSPKCHRDLAEATGGVTKSFAECDALGINSILNYHRDLRRYYQRDDRYIAEYHIYY